MGVKIVDNTSLLLNSCAGLKHDPFAKDLAGPCWSFGLQFPAIEDQHAASLGLPVGFLGIV